MSVSDTVIVANHFTESNNLALALKQNKNASIYNVYMGDFKL